MDLRVQMNTGGNRDISELAMTAAQSQAVTPGCFDRGFSSEAAWIPAKGMRKSRSKNSPLRSKLRGIEPRRFANRLIRSAAISSAAGNIWFRARATAPRQHGYRRSCAVL